MNTLKNPTHKIRKSWKGLLKTQNKKKTKNPRKSPLKTEKQKTKSKKKTKRKSQSLFLWHGQEDLTVETMCCSPPSMCSYRTLPVLLGFARMAWCCLVYFNKALFAGFFVFCFSFVLCFLIVVSASVYFCLLLK